MYKIEFHIIPSSRSVIPLLSGGAGIDDAGPAIVTVAAAARAPACSFTRRRCSKHNTYIIKTIIYSRYSFIVLYRDVRIYL